jgi:transcriptional regulator with XRE-family HTH domain
MSAEHPRPEFNADQPSRLEQLDNWLQEREITRTQLARRMGVHPSMVGKIFLGQKQTPARIRELIDLGIPAELLPEPQKPRKRGPKPKHVANTPDHKPGGEG